MKMIDAYLEFMQPIIDWLVTANFFELTLLLLLVFALMAMMGLLLLLLNK